MTRVSKIPIKKDVIEDLLDSFVTLISDLKNKEEIKAFLKDFLTPEERLMLSKRLALAFMIRQGFSWDEIGGILKVSKTSINQMKNWLHYKKGIEAGIERLVEREEPKQRGETNRFSKFVELALASKSSGKARAKLTSGNY